MIIRLLVIAIILGAAWHFSTSAYMAARVTLISTFSWMYEDY